MYLVLLIVVAILLVLIIRVGNKKSDDSYNSYNSYNVSTPKVTKVGDRYKKVVDFLMTLDERYHIVENEGYRLTMRLISREVRSCFVLSLSGSILSIRGTFENDWSEPQSISWNFDSNMSQEQMIDKMDNDLNKMAMESMPPY